jgi:hypothetical protein
LGEPQTTDRAPADGDPVITTSRYPEAGTVPAEEEIEMGW